MKHQAGALEVDVIPDINTVGGMQVSFQAISPKGFLSHNRSGGLAKSLFERNTEVNPQTEHTTDHKLFDDKWQFDGKFIGSFTSIPIQTLQECMSRVDWVKQVLKTRTSDTLWSYALQKS
jgi:hypothetical protein